MTGRRNAPRGTPHCRGPSSSGCGYNDFQRLDEQVKAGWSEVLNQYQRRADLIPNIVATVKGEANFEQETLTKVIEARAKATSRSRPRRN
jgi:LemA protein